MSQNNDRRKKLHNNVESIKYCNKFYKIMQENELLNLKEHRKFAVKKEREALTT